MKSPENTDASKIFISKSDGSTLRQIVPERRPRGWDSHLPGAEASEIRKKAEVVGVYFSGAGGSGYSFSTEHDKEKKHFKIITDGWKELSHSDEAYARIAREIEEKLGKKGLSVIIY